MAEYILETRNLRKYYRRQLVVKDVSLRVPAGSIYGLIGPNGSGKSTILKLLTGLLHPDGGEIIVFGEPWQRKHLAHIGALIESPAIYGNLTAAENLLIHTKLMGLPGGVIDEVLGTVGLKDAGKKLASQFSLGMKQRLGIAIALLGEPKLLILDEPTNGIDPVGIQELRGLIRSLSKRGITVILSSHILKEVSQVVDYIGIISDGRLKYQGKINPDEDLESLFMEVLNIEEDKK
ncbi:lantibiotic protection ABC transporter ATP-binding protein [Thermovenabulum gondwanense]|uniref:lantibiotic protection ABC transporter ATP-binding protein n=1 Tax=Thermovenabulum gondwanense TaxID=520767 RepID=UPI001FE18172|nr:lantibiotic protection ABC transporter ATP-binding protein [Thermovenabulum gondwanense]